MVHTITFAVALLTSTLAKVPRRPAPTTSATRGGRRRWRGLRDARSAVVWISRQRGLRGTYAVLTVLNLLGGAFLIPLIVLVGERGADALATGTVLAGAGIGGLIGALAANRIGRLLPVGPMLLTVVALFGVSLAVMPLPLGPWWPMVPLTVIMLSTPSINVVMDAVVAGLVPEDMLGRVGAALTVVARGLAPLGPVLGGALAGVLGASVGLLVLGGLLVLTAMTAATSRTLRGFTGEKPAVSLGPAG